MNPLVDSLLAELGNPPPMRRCGIHGDDTTGGRCATCDAEAGRPAPVKVHLNDRQRQTMSEQASAIATRAAYVLAAIRTGTIDDAGLAMRRLQGIGTIADALEGRIRRQVRRQEADG